MEATRGKFLAIMSSRIYTQFDPEELRELYDGCKRYMKLRDPGLSQDNYLSLMEMLFYVGVYLCDDVESQVLYNTFRDKFGEDSPRLYAMKATLLQINEGDAAAVKFIESLTKERLEIDTDTVSYLLLQKKLLAIERREHDQEWLLRQVLSLIEKFPIDPELWSVAGNTYFGLGQFERAAYCLEEVICVTPFNYPAFGRLAEILYYKALRVDKPAAKARATLQQALNNALRSVELSESYLKGWSLVAATSQKLEGKKKLLTLAKSRLEQIAQTSNPRNKATAEVILKNI
ncbi:related to ER membrane protein complex subunit 2 [Zygosaccharomyces bailii]|nr:related to ER membrane protein complex subunit 2 [Zygosaccharomyces bailii]